MHFINGVSFKSLCQGQQIVTNFYIKKKTLKISHYSGNFSTTKIDITFVHGQYHHVSVHFIT